MQVTPRAGDDAEVQEAPWCTAAVAVARDTIPSRTHPKPRDRPVMWSCMICASLMGPYCSKYSLNSAVGHIAEAASASVVKAATQQAVHQASPTACVQCKDLHAGLQGMALHRLCCAASRVKCWAKKPTLGGIWREAAHKYFSGLGLLLLWDRLFGVNLQPAERYAYQ